ncbi:hypothetical protein BKA63DRAFT_499548 [Paraphoma chrysanthemicola]|nr:hypothetical protein BKA63DRAFT_499548 [Paraphoma chrysanthemicola]
MKILFPILILLSVVTYASKDHGIQGCWNNHVDGPCNWLNMDKMSRCGIQKKNDRARIYTCHWGCWREKEVCAEGRKCVQSTDAMAVCNGW